MELCCLSLYKTLIYGSFIFQRIDTPELLPPSKLSHSLFLSKNYSDGQHTDPEPVKSPTPSLIAVEIIYEEKLKPQS